MSAHNIKILLCLFLAFSATGHAGEKEQMLLQRAVQAQGGESNVARLRTMRIKCEGTSAFNPGQPVVRWSLEDTWQMPDQYRSIQTFEVNGAKTSQLSVNDGKKGWIQQNGQTQAMTKDDIAERLEQEYAENLDRLQFLKDKALEIDSVEDIKIDGKPAAGVRIRSKGHRDVRLYFDMDTGLLVKREHSLFDPASGKEVVQEVYFTDYQDHHGTKYPGKLVAHRGGKIIAEIKVVEVEFFDKLDAKVFAKP
jgi:hypothetical protein